MEIPQKRNKINMLQIPLFVLYVTSVCQSQNALYNVYIGEYPRGEVVWAQDAQGVAHDDNYWYITQTRTLWKIPLVEDLKKVSRNTQSVSFIDLNTIDSLWKNGKSYDHFGDLTYYNYEGRGYLFVPIEDDNRRRPDGSASAIVVFDAESLTYINHAIVGLPEAPWCEIDSRGFLYISNTGYKCKVMTIDWRLLNESNKLKFTNSVEFTFLDENGNPLLINTPQGGAISLNGEFLYLSAGYWTGFDNSWGINVFDMQTKRRIQKSINGKGPFNYEFHPYGGFFLVLQPQEPEGMTIWETNSISNSILGQLHVIMSEQNAFNDNVYFKHYTTSEAYPVLYEHDDFGGQPLPVRNNIPSLSLKGFNDRASSIWVPSGWTVVLYQDDNYKGSRKKINASGKSFNRFGWNDRVSSITVFQNISN